MHTCLRSVNREQRKRLPDIPESLLSLCLTQIYLLKGERCGMKGGDMDDDIGSHWPHRPLHQLYKAWSDARKHKEIAAR